MGEAAHLLILYLPSYGYVALFFLLLISGTYIPIPGGLILIAAGALVRIGYLNPFLAAVAAAAGSITSDVVTFSIARRLGRHRIYKRYVESHKFAKRMETYALKYPKTAIFLSRFVGLISTPVNAVMGLSQVRLKTFVSMDTLGNLVCTVVYLSIGYIIGTTAAQTHLSSIIAIVLGVLAASYITIFALIHLLGA